MAGAGFGCGHRQGRSRPPEADGLRGRLQALQTALHSGCSQLSSARDAVLTVVNGVWAVGWQVADDGTATLPPWFPAHLRIMAAPFTRPLRPSARPPAPSRRAHRKLHTGRRTSPVKRGWWSLAAAFATMLDLAAVR